MKELGLLLSCRFLSIERRGETQHGGRNTEIRLEHLDSLRHSGVRIGMWLS